MNDYPWYDERVTHLTHELKKLNITEIGSSSTPKEIYQYLDERVWKQNEAKKAAAMLMWKALNGIKENVLFCGPSGCGKTEIWRQLSAVFPDRIAIVDCSAVSQDAWKGSVKWSDMIESPIFKSNQNTILVMDEADKMMSPKFSSGGENVAQSVMSEGLKMLEGTIAKVTRNSVTYPVDTNRISFVLLGAFSNKATDIAEQNKGPSIGFGALPDDVKPYTNPLTMQDIIDFGAMPEFVGRIQKIVNLEPMLQTDFYRMLEKRKNGPIQNLEKQYRIKLDLSGRKREELAQNAYESGLGVRQLTNQLVKLIDDGLFEDPEQKYLEFI